MNKVFQFFVNSGAELDLTGSLITLKTTGEIFKAINYQQFPSVYQWVIDKMVELVLAD